jgi:hypothetical protein
VVHPCTGDGPVLCVACCPTCMCYCFPRRPCINRMTSPAVVMLIPRRLPRLSLASPFGRNCSFGPAVNRVVGNLVVEEDPALGGGFLSVSGEPCGVRDGQRVPSAYPART